MGQYFSTKNKDEFLVYVWDLNEHGIDMLQQHVYAMFTTLHCILPHPPLIVLMFSK